MKKYLIGIVVVQFATIVYLLDQRGELSERIKDSGEAIAASTKTIEAVSDSLKICQRQSATCRADLSKYQEIERPQPIDTISSQWP